MQAKRWWAGAFVVLAVAGLALSQRPDPERPPERGLFRPAAPAAQITASGKFLYVLRGEEILQFDATSLELVKKVRLPAQERPQPPRE
jgi:hypothetical protein